LAIIQFIALTSWQLNQSRVHIWN